MLVPRPLMFWTCGDLRMGRPQSLYEIIFRREHRRSRHQHHHDLAGAVPGPDQHMAQEAVPRILIVYLHFKRRDQLPDRPDDIVCLLILNKTGIHRKNKMGPLLVYAGNDPPLPVPGYDRMDLISVMPGVLHSDHVTDLTEWL